MSWCVVRVLCQALREDVVHDIAENIREAKGPASVIEGQAFVVETEEVENGCVEIVHVHGILRDPETKVV